MGEKSGCMCRCSVQEVRQQTCVESMLRAVPLIFHGVAGVVRKNAKFVQGVLANFVAMLCDVNTDDWKADEYQDEPDEDHDSPWIVAREALARIADTIGGNAVVSPGFVKHLSTLIRAEAWQKRWAALESLSMLASSGGCASVIKKKTGLVDQVLRFLTDPHQRVRQVALECTARFANAFPGDFQEKYGTILLPQLARMSAGADAPAPSLMMVRGTAMAVLVDFCNPDDERCTHETLIPHLKTVLESIGRLLTAAKAHEVVQQKCLVALARVAQIAEEDFGQYYSFFSKGLEQVLRSARSDVHGELRAEAIRCVGMIAAAVGPEQFTGHDAAKFIGLIQAGARSTDILNDPQLRPILRAVVAICRSIEDQAVRDRAVKFVLPLVQKVLSTEIEFKYKQVEEGEKVDVDTARGMSGATLAIRGLGNVNLQLNTELIDDKVAACEAFGDLAENLPQYINKAVVSVFAPLLTAHIEFKFLSAVRTGSALAVAKLLGAMAKAVAKSPSAAGSEMLQKLFTMSVPAMMKRLELEDPDGAGWMALAIKHAVQVCARALCLCACAMRCAVPCKHGFTTGHHHHLIKRAHRRTNAGLRGKQRDSEMSDEVHSECHVCAVQKYQRQRRQSDDYYYEPQKQQIPRPRGDGRNYRSRTHRRDRPLDRTHRLSGLLSQVAGATVS